MLKEILFGAAAAASFYDPVPVHLIAEIAAIRYNADKKNSDPNMKHKDRRYQRSWRAARQQERRPAFLTYLLSPAADLLHCLTGIGPHQVCSQEKSWRKKTIDMKEESRSNAIKIWAHRGANEFAPENTLEAFGKAADLGADGVELDVHQTMDHEIVVIHDEKLERTSSGRGFVKNYTLEGLRQFDYAKGTRFEGKAHYAIPTLQEVFELLRPTGLTVNIELKTNVFPYPGIEARILRMAEEFGMRERVCYSSFNRLSIEKIHLLDPNAKVDEILKVGDEVEAFAKGAENVSGIFFYFNKLQYQ